MLTPLAVGFKRVGEEEEPPGALDRHRGRMYPFVTHKGFVLFTLRCTQKLLARLGSAPAAEEVEPTTRLGDWYGNLVYRPRGQVVLFVNERSLLPVLVAASPASSLVTRFQTAAIDMLLRVGVPEAIVEVERREMTEARIGKTASRKVLGSMTDFAYLLDGYRRDPMDLEGISLRLADAPCRPLGMKRPREVAVEDMLAGPG